MTPDKIRQLQGFLERIPERYASPLAAAVERDKLSGGRGLPHDAILESLRPVLRKIELRLERLPSAQRLFSVPFEDLLLDGPRPRKQRGRIARSSIQIVWDWLAKDLMPAEHARLVDEIKGLLLQAGPVAALGTVAELQAKAAAAIVAAIPSIDPEDETFKKAARRLGGAEIALDAVDMGRMLEAAPDIRELQLRLPQRIDMLLPEHIAVMRDAFDKLTDRYPDLGPYLVFFAMGRLKRPWEMLRLAGAISRKMDDILISATDVGGAGDLILTDLENHAHALKNMRIVDLDVERVLSAVESFAQLSTGFVRELGIRRDGTWGKRLMAARADVAESMEAIIERAPKDILGALPVHRVGSFGKSAPRRPDLTHALDPEKAARAEKVARILAGARYHAAAGAFAASMKATMEELAGGLRHYTDDVMSEIRALDAQDLPKAQTYLHFALNLCELILGHEETELLRRRAVVALQRESA